MIIYIHIEIVTVHDLTSHKPRLVRILSRFLRTATIVLSILPERSRPLAKLEYYAPEHRSRR